MSATDPLTISSAFTAWRFDPSTVVLVVVVTGGYYWCLGRARARGIVVPTVRAAAFGFGVVCWIVAGLGMPGVYSNTLFWVRALQVLTLLYLVPFGLAFGTPLTVLRGALSDRQRTRMDWVLDSTVARFVAHPAVTSIAMLATPWLLYLTNWYRVVLHSGVVDSATRLLLVVIGFAYYYARLQADPVPHRYTQLISLAITFVETLGDGVLGVVLWQGPVRFADYYNALGRGWGPSPRTDQSIGAGVLWILGDVIGLPLLLALMTAFHADERRTAARIDRDLDAAEHESNAATVDDDAAPAQSGLWWENDPQLRARFRHR